MRKIFLITALALTIVLGSCVVMGSKIKPSETDMKITYVDANAAAELLAADPDMGVVDVRTGLEYKTGHIKGAVHNGFIGLGFAKRLGGLERTTPYLVVCRTGHRSIPALQSFDKMGFTHIVHLDGGMQAWKKAGLPTIK